MQSQWGVTGLVCALAGAAFVAACSSEAGPAHAPPPACDLAEGITPGDCKALHEMSLPATLPAAAGNAHADDDNAAELGFLIFYDGHFSSNNDVRCATCHMPEVRFNDAKPVSTGLETVTRNAPTILNASRMQPYFWDGRADSMWSQPLFAFENPKEMGFTRLGLAHEIATSYADRYTQVFGALPPLDVAKRFPAAGKPGDAAWEAMAPEDQDAINRVAANVGKALEAYERKVSAGPSAFDRYLAGDATQMTASQKRGLSAFVRAGCMDCHSGPMFSDMAFHNLGIPAAAGQAPDEGRAAGIPVLAADIFNTQGVFADPGTPKLAIPVVAPGDEGAFRTPTLRNVTESAPYGHNGSYLDLQAIIAFHLKGGGRGGAGFVGEVDAKIVARTDITDADIADIVDFLGTLVGDYPLHPWNDWPQK